MVLAMTNASPHRRQLRERRENLKISAGKQDTGNAIDEPWFIEIDEKTDRDIKQLHITQQLGLVNREYTFDRLGFN
jgi:hypothetical protein